MLKLLLLVLAQFTLGLCVLCPSGGFGSCCNGRSWTDYNDFSRDGNLTGIRVWFTEFVNGIQARYGSQWTHPVRGDALGAKAEIVVNQDDPIIMVGVRSGQLVDQITFHTNMTTYGPYGGWGGTASTAKEGTHLAYIAGREGEQIDQLHFYFDNC